MREERLTCPICYEIFLNPTLCKTCGKSYCRQCIYQWLESHFSCPNCNNLMIRSSECLLPNRDLRLLVEDYREEQNLTQPVDPSADFLPARTLSLEAIPPPAWDHLFWTLFQLKFPPPRTTQQKIMRVVKGIPLIGPICSAIEYWRKGDMVLVKGFLSAATSHLFQMILGHCLMKLIVDRKVEQELKRRALYREFSSSLKPELTYDI